MHNIVDAVVVFPGNLFYGTTIPGSILFINKKKPEHRKDKVLMIYAAKKGWYKEEANMNTLQPHDMLRISTILESWGDSAIAQTWIDSQKARLKGLILEDLEFKLSEIEEYYHEDLTTLSAKLLKAKKIVADKEAEDKKPTKTELKNVENQPQAAFNKLQTEKENKIHSAHTQAEKERRAIDEVEQEFLQCSKIQNYEKIVLANMEELEENEFNLNIPRYVDTFEPEEEIVLNKAITDFKASLEAESKLDQLIVSLEKSLIQN